MEEAEAAEAFIDDQQFGTAKDGGWTPETLSYRRDPTIENYVRLRRADPQAEINVHIHGGLDHLYANEPELRKYGVNPDIFVGIFDADPETISYYALFFLEKIIEKRKLEAAGETQLVARGLVVPDKLIDWFITCSLDAMSRYGLMEIERDLIVLIRERLGGPFVEYEERTLIKEKRLWAAWGAGAMIARGETPSFRKIADRMGVSQTTVMRWFEGRDFMAEAEKWSAHFDAEGNTIPVWTQEKIQAAQKTLRENERAQQEED